MIEVVSMTNLDLEIIGFIKNFGLGRGDYTKERRQWLNQKLDDIVKEIKERAEKESEIK